MKTVIITGAGGGLGKTVTQHFLKAGYRVVATVRNEAAKKELQPHPHLHVTAVDLNDAAAGADLVEQTVRAHGAVHAALLLAGGLAGGTLSETSDDAIRQQVAVNFLTAWHIARPLLSHLLKAGEGRIVFIGGRPALRAEDGKDAVPYGLSKSLLFKLAEYINAEAEGTGVTASVVVPSTIDTPANRKSMPKADPADWVSTQTLAEMLAFICSDAGASLRETVLKAYNKA